MELLSLCPKKLHCPVLLEMLDFILKVIQTCNVFFKPTKPFLFLPNSTNDQIVSFVFRKNSSIAKNPFEID